MVIEIDCVNGISACEREQTNAKYVIEMHDFLLLGGDKPHLFKLCNMSTCTNIGARAARPSILLIYPYGQGPILPFYQEHYIPSGSQEDHRKAVVSLNTITMYAAHLPPARSMVRLPGNLGVI
jgi:hypothetical protein